MPAVVRLGDICSGHGCFPSRPNITGSNKFFIESKAIHRVGDKWAPHTCESTHDGTQSTGSNKMFVQGKAVARISDKISCGSSNQTGSSKMFVGG